MGTRSAAAAIACAAAATMMTVHVQQQLVRATTIAIIRARIQSWEPAAPEKPIAATKQTITTTT